MAKLAIKGHPTWKEEVIEILEMLGGKNTNNYIPYCICLYYYIDDSTKIISDDWFSSCANENFIIYTLEDFFEKFPYKVGDEVIAYAEGCLAHFTIQDIRWNNKLNKIEYKICSSWYDTSIIQPYKEEEIMKDKPNLLQQLKEYFEGNPQEVVEKEWHELEKLFVPIFSINNIIRHKERKKNKKIVKIENGNYIFEYGTKLPIYLQNDYEFVTDKFDITTLKPFDKVLVRDDDNRIWKGNFFSCYYSGFYVCVGGDYRQCIPYKGNEHLLGENTDCEDYYKNWR